MTTKKTGLLLSWTLLFGMVQAVNAGGILTELLLKPQVFGQVRSITDRRTSDRLLKGARQAISNGNVELAEWYITRAEMLDVKYESVFQRWVDTPEKVREAIAVFKTTGQAPRVPVSNQPIAASSKDQPTARDEATEFLNNGRAALAKGKIDDAIEWYRGAVATRAEFAPGEYSPTSLAQALTQNGVDTALLASPDLESSTPVSMELPDEGTAVNAVDQASSLVDPAQRRRDAEPNSHGISSNSLLERGKEISQNKPNIDPRWLPLRTETLRLLAEARLAMDRGDLRSAETLARSAQNLRVPDSAYLADDTRPWMVLMEISRRQERVQSYESTQGLAQTIQPPPAATTDPAAYITSGYDPIGRVAPASATTTVTPGSLSAPPPNTLAQQNYPYPSPRSLPVNNSSSFPPNPAPAIPLPSVGPPGSGSASDVPPGLGALPIPESQTPLRVQTPPVEAVEMFPSPADVTPPSTMTSPPVARATTRPSTAMKTPTDNLAPSFASDDPISSAIRQSTPSATAPSQAPLQTASEVDPPVRLTTPPPASSAPPSTTAPAPISDGEILYRDGEAALLDHDTSRARQLFLEAWQYEKELTPETRQRLQDHLQALRRVAEPEPVVDILTDNQTAANQSKLRALVGELSRQQAAINAIRESDPMQAWEKIRQLRTTVAEADVDDATRQRLLSRVERASTEMENYVQANRSRIENDVRNKRIVEEIDRVREQRVRNQQKLADFVEQFNQMIDQQRFAEAAVLAKQAAEIDPLNPVVQNMTWKSRVARQVIQNIARSQRFDDNALQMLGDVSNSAVPMSGDIEFPDVRYWEDISRRRREQLADKKQQYTAVELEIRNALKNRVDVQFTEMPLSAVLEKLAQMSGVNLFLDPEGLAAEGVTSETTVSINLLKPVSLKSALNMILEPLHLSYVVQNEVLRITSEHVRDGDVRPRVYNVADLVIPIPNFVPGNSMGLPAALRDAYNMINQGYNGGYKQMPFTMGQSQGGSSNPSLLTQLGAASGGNSNPGMGSTGNLGGGSIADFDTLIELITTTVSPETWEEVGGTGTIAGFPTNLSLVVAQTQEVHEKIVDLLAQLRRLQDLQVTIEVRFITLNDDFFERIGIDFDFDIDDNTGLTVAEVNELDDDGPSITIGLDPTTGAPTADLDVGFTQGSFGAATPAFGGFDPSAAANLGFAILSDIEAFFIIQASQGDSRTNILQAPKVTLFNGQQAFVADQSQRPFVTSIIPVVGDFAAAHQPVITVLTEGTSLSVQAVVSQDRRFVRLTLVPFFSQINGVEEFTFDGSRSSNTGTNVVDPTDETQTLINNAINANIGTTVQLPTFAFTSVTTTVSVPDGGTILLGGIKRLREGRAENGVPMLSKLPYINRLFKNVGIGRDTQSLMMMVTPRIIIQEEEEERLGLTLP